MSYNNNVLVQCEDLQFKLGNVWANYSETQDPIPFLEYLRSAENRNGMEQTISPGNGKVKNVTLTYFPRIPESAVLNEDGRNCAAPLTYGNNFQNYTIDTEDVISSGETITGSDLARFCDNNPEYIASRILAHMLVIDRATATKTANEAALLKGLYSDYVTGDPGTYTVNGSDNLVVATKAAGLIVPGAWENIQSAATATGFNGTVGFGGSAMKEYMNLTMNGCCANQGLDVRAIYDEFGFFFGYDPKLAVAMGNITNGNLIMIPGALQMLTYTLNQWRDGMPVEFSAGGYAAFNGTTPAGVPVDIYITDNCPGTLAIKIIANTKLVALPNDMFVTGDVYAGVTGSAGVTVLNA